eukprot:gene3103-3881_t
MNPNKRYKRNKVFDYNYEIDDNDDLANNNNNRDNIDYLQQDDIFDQQQQQQDQEHFHDIQFIKYRIFSDFIINSNDSKQIEQHYIDLINSIDQLLDSYINNYLWQKDPFYLKLYQPTTTTTTTTSANNNKIPIHIYGISRYEDSIEDEWFIVFLLVQISIKFPNLSISVKDNDGEFLLIESAKTLPKWIKPNLVKNRVFIRNGYLHVIPLPNSPTDIDTIPFKMDILSAINILHSNQFQTKINPSTWDIIKNRISKFEEGSKEFILEQNHIKSVYIPIEIGYLLNQSPQLMSDIVTTFYYRDSDDMKSVSKMERFPVNRDRDRDQSKGKMVSCKVRFTRCLYAQLKQQKFNPPRSFPPLPPPNDKLYLEKSLGTKLICGLEMVYANSKRLSQKQKQHSSTTTTNFNIDNYDFQSDSGWIQFKKNLENNQYFSTELIGSKLYKEKLIRAKTQYLNSIKDNNNDDQQQQQQQQQLNNNDSDEKDTSLSEFIDDLINNVSVEEMLKIINQSNNSLVECSDEWMDEIPSKIEDLLYELEEQHGDGDEGDLGPSNFVDKFSKSFKSMLSQQSSILKGVDFEEY